MCIHRFVTIYDYLISYHITMAYNIISPKYTLSIQHIEAPSLFGSVGDHLYVKLQKVRHPRHGRGPRVRVELRHAASEGYCGWSDLAAGQGRTAVRGICLEIACSEGESLAGKPSNTKKMHPMAAS